MSAMDEHVLVVGSPNDSPDSPEFAINVGKHGVGVRSDGDLAGKRSRIRPTPYYEVNDVVI